MSSVDRKRLLVFHPVIAPYRIDFFNQLSSEYETRVCLFQHNLLSQSFDYDSILSELEFSPVFLDEKIGPFRRGVISQINEFQPDVIMVAEAGLVPLTVLAYKYLSSKSYKVVSIVDDSYDMLVNKNQISKAHSIAEKLLFPLLDEVIVVEPRVSEYLQKKYSKGCFFPIIQSENRFEHFLKLALPIAESLISKYELAGNKILLSICRLVEVKNLKTSIDAFMKVEDPSARYVIVGSGPEQEALRRQASSDSRIVFTGRKEGAELYAWYLLASCFILPSLQEAFGAVTDEALSAGCWCLISNRAGSSCLIEEGKNGNIIDPLDVEIMTARISEALDRSEPLSTPVNLRSSRRLLTFEDYFRPMDEKLKAIL